MDTSTRTRRISAIDRDLEAASARVAALRSERQRSIDAAATAERLRRAETQMRIVLGGLVLGGLAVVDRDALVTAARSRRRSDAPAWEAIAARWAFDLPELSPAPAAAARPAAAAPDDDDVPPSAVPLADRIAQVAEWRRDRDAHATDPSAPSKPTEGVDA